MPPSWRPALLSPATSPAPYTTSPLKPLTTGEMYLTVLSMRLALLPVVAIRFLVSPAVPEPKGSIAATARYCGVYWRPSSKVPLLLCKPTYAWRPNSRPPCPVVPVSPWKPFSSRKMADVPPPKSSLPLKPRREPDSTPLVSLLVVAMPPLSRTSAMSKMPYTVTFDCAAAVPAEAPNKSASIVFFIILSPVEQARNEGCDRSPAIAPFTASATSDASGAETAACRCFYRKPWKRPAADDLHQRADLVADRDLRKAGGNGQRLQMLYQAWIVQVHGRTV